MDILLVVTVGALCIGCFLIGAKVGQTVSKGEDIVLPEVNPVKAVTDHRNKRKAEKEKNKYDTILRNIDSYDGTGVGQEDVPR